MQKFYSMAGSCFVFLLMALHGYAQNNLSAGDLAFVSYQSDKDLSNTDLGGTTTYTDRFSIMVLKSGGLAAGTVIYFTDNGWNSTTANFISGLSEGFIKWVVPAGGIARGTEVFFISSYNDPVMSWAAWLNENGTSTAGAVTTESGSNYMELSSAGDQVLVYQTGPTAGPAGAYNNTTIRFITAIHANAEVGTTTYANWDGATPSGGHQSSMPPGLTNGVSALVLTTAGVLPIATVGAGEYDNGKYSLSSGSFCSTTLADAAVYTNSSLTLSNTAFAIGSTSMHPVFTFNNPVTFSINPGNVSACNGLTAAFSATPTGTSPFTYQWQQSTDAGFTSPTTLGDNTVYSGTGTSALSILDNTGLNGLYYRLVITNVCGAVNSTAASLSLSSTLPTTASSFTQAVNTNNNLYYSSPCVLISKVVPSGASAVTGNVTSKVWVESSVPNYKGEPFVARHYEITPATNATTATGTVTLYFTQAEFTAFNAAANSYLKLPTGPTDNTGISNLRVGKYSGTSSNGTGFPGTYPGPITIIDPNDANIVWNAAFSRWEVTLNVTGFSGFIIQTSTSILPVDLTSFTGRLNNNDVLLQWQTESEVHHDYFEVQRSTDGQTYTALGRVPGTNGNGLQSYSWLDAGAGQLNASKLYYRLKMVSTTGDVDYSKVVTLSPSQNGSPVVSVAPNPFTSYVKVTLQMPEAAQVAIRLSDVTGKTLQTQYVNVTKGETTLPVSGVDRLVPGIYLLSVQFNGQVYTYKLVK